MGFLPVFSNPFQKSFPMKSNVSGWWLSGGIVSADCVLAYQPKGAASLSSSYTNLAHPGTYTATPGVAPTWDATNGWNGNGTKWLNTQYVMPSPSISVFVRVSGLASPDRYFFGQSETAGDIFGIVNYQSKDYVCGRTDNSTGGAAVTDGTFGLIGNTNGLACSGYYNASLVKSFNSGYQTITPTIALAVMARRTPTGVSNLLNGYVQAFVIYSRRLTNAEAIAVSTAMQAL